MTFSEFVEETLCWWEQYLRFITIMRQEGKLDSNGGGILFPNILLVTNCSGFYVAELAGATKEFNGLLVKKHKERSIYRYLSQFDDQEPDALMSLNGYNHIFRFLCLAQEADFQEVAKRFPHIELYGSRLNRTGGRGSVFSFGNKFESCAIENCVLINRRVNTFRCKNILSAYVVRSGISKIKLKEFYKYTIANAEVKGIHTVKGKEEEKLLLAGQFQSMYLFPNLRETTIGDFINLHPEIVRTAFKTKHFEYEPYLEWIEHDDTCKDKAINPDLLVKRNDGYYDIYDLKTAAIEKSNLTKGGRKRRRFIDYVEEGVAQLANYREYFNYAKNAQYAMSKYGIKVNNPKLVLVVGNWENISVEEVKQACRRFNNIEIIDYDTICQLFIGAS